MVRIEAGAVTAPPPATGGAVNLVFVLDASWSIGEDAFAATTQAVAEASVALAADYAGSGVRVEVHVVTFSAVVSQSGPYDLSTDLAALTADLAALEVIGPGTRWDAALAATEAILDGQPGGESNAVIFISDGVPTRNFTDELASLTDAGANGYSVEIAGFGVDGDSDLSALSVVDSGNEATVLTGAADVVAAVPPAPEPEIVPEAMLIGFELELVADGVSQGVIAGLDDLVETGEGLALDLASLAGIEALLGETNTLLGSASFDLDGDAETVDDVETLVLHGTLDGDALAGVSDALLPLPDMTADMVPDPGDGQGETAALALEDVLDTSGVEGELVIQADGFDAGDGAGGNGSSPPQASAEDGFLSCDVISGDVIGGAGDVLASLGIDTDATVDLVPSA